MNISNCAAANLGTASLSDSNDMVAMSTEKQSTEVESNVLPKCSAPYLGYSLPESRDIKSRDVISTKDYSGFIQSNPEAVKKQAVKDESVLPIIPYGDESIFTTMDWFEVYWPTYTMDVNYFYRNFNILEELMDDVQGVMKKNLAVFRTGNKEKIRKMPEIIVKVLIALVFDSSPSERKMYKSLRGEVVLYLSEENLDGMISLSRNYRDEIFRPRMKVYMKRLESYIKDHVCCSYYRSFYYFLGRGDFDYALNSLYSATNFIDKYQIKNILAEKSRILLYECYLCHADGCFDGALIKLNESADGDCPQAIWNSAIIEMGLCNEYKHKSNPAKAFKRLRLIHDEVKRWEAKNKPRSLSDRQSDIQDTIKHIWNYFKVRTMHAEDFPKSRDYCFKMIANIAKTFGYVGEGVVSALNSMGEKDIFDDPLLAQLMAKIYPASDYGRAQWQELYGIFNSHLMSAAELRQCGDLIAKMKEKLIEMDIPEDIISQFFDFNPSALDDMRVFLAYSYDFIVNYIEWTQTVKKKRKGSDTDNKSEILKTLRIINDLAQGCTDVTNKETEWLANPPEWLTGTVPSQEWARQSLAARYGLCQEGVNHEKADFYVHMCEHACANEFNTTTDLSAIPVSTTEEEGGLDYADTASSTIQSNTSPSEHYIIVKAVSLIESDKEEDAVHFLQTFINNNNSAVVEHWLGYVKELQSRCLNGDEFREKQDEIIKHYKSAGSKGIEYAAERADMFLRNQNSVRMAIRKRDKQSQKSTLKCTDVTSSYSLCKSLSSMDLENCSASVADDHDELFEPLPSQACELESEEPIEFDGPPELDSGEVKHEAYIPLPKAIAQYNAAMEDVDGYGSDIDFDRAYSAIRSMQYAVKTDKRIPVATRIQVEQYKAWYYYKLLKYSDQYKFDENEKRSFRMLFYNALINGFGLLGITIIVTDTVTSVSDIKKSEIQKRLHELCQDVRIQLGSLASTWGHFCSDLYPHRNEHQALYDLSSWLNPSKNRSHLANIPSAKLTVVEDIEPLRLPNKSSRRRNKTKNK
ncbi:MAG: hypothetical protein QS721_03815 [Candidatus Endonucleobacter sp. (ex Gigantidas childressi)]|nr:hypothetical protein [Candidatus Endonucleobacter sp. (ex Gigantidas childressi)]